MDYGRTASTTSTRIAGRLTVEDWMRRKESLAVDGSAAAWKSAFDEFFHQRLSTRYFGPIELIERLPQPVGEGFAIMALHCSTVEFLGAILEGKKYRYDPSGRHTDAQTEYNRSSDMFVSFLERAPPFKDQFSGGLALQFYTHVRCPLLHEARTSGGWTIQVQGGKKGELVDPEKRIVWRDRFPRAFHQFVSWYREELSTSPQYQAAFVRKFDGLCDES